MNDPLNRTNAPAIIRLFDVCFKQGVIDAYETGDNFAVQEFISAHFGKWTFGSIGESEDYDWRSFRFVLYRWARENGLTNLAENYIIMIRKPNYLWCLLPYCMWFYLMGAREWLDYPSPSQIEVFKMTSRIHWSPSCKVKRMTRMDFISYMHEACFEYRKFDDELKLVGDNTMDSFCQAVYDLTRAYVTGK